MATDLITLNDYLDATGQNVVDLDPDTTNQLTWAITVASNTVRKYCDRDFTLNADAVQGTRNFRYRGDNMLEIDDASAVNSVAITANQWSPGRTLDASEWIADDMNAEVLSYLEIYSIAPWGSGSPQMGFKSNLDQYPMRFYPTVMTVNAVWGWPEIPSDVQHALVITVLDFSNPNSGQLSTSQSQSIASYSTSSSLRGAIVLPESALPYKAQALLDPYAKIAV